MNDTCPGTDGLGYRALDLSAHLAGDMQTAASNLRPAGLATGYTASLSSGSGGTGTPGEPAHHPALAILARLGLAGRPPAPPARNPDLCGANHAALAQLVRGRARWRWADFALIVQECVSRPHQLFCLSVSCRIHPGVRRGYPVATIWGTNLCRQPGRTCHGARNGGHDDRHPRHGWAYRLAFCAQWDATVNQEIDVYHHGPLRP